MMCWKQTNTAFKIVTDTGRISQSLYRCQSMKKSGKCAKTGQEAAWSDLRGKVAFCRDNIGVTEVRVETLSHPDYYELWPQHFLFLAADSHVSQANLSEESHKMWARWVLLLLQMRFHRSFWSA